MSTSLHRKLRFTQLLATSLWALIPIASSMAQGLPSNVEQLLSEAKVPLDSLAVYVTSRDGKDVKLAHQEGLAMSPASTMKVLTTAIALEELGPSFRWKTQLLSASTPKGATLRGPLYLRGGGAPDLSWERMALMLRQLREQGIRHLEGELVLDRHLFRPSRFDLNLPPFDESPDAYYNVIPDALLVNSNLSDFSLESTDKNLRVQMSPPLADVRVIHRMTLNDLPCTKWEEKWLRPVVTTDKRQRTTITLLGEFPRNCKAHQNINIFDRNLYIENLFRHFWKELGGRWKGHAIDGVVPAGTKVLIEHNSDTLADNVKLINKRSDNAMTRLLYLSLGIDTSSTSAGTANQSLSTGKDTRREGVESLTSFQAAEQRIRAWLRSKGIEDQGLVLENGSGLSRSERISPKQLGAVLKALAESNWYPELSTSLPIAAVDGTMRKRLLNTAAASRSRIKTGTLKDVVAVAGYVRDQSNKEWIIVAMINHERASKARAALDALIEWTAAGGQ